MPPKMKSARWFAERRKTQLEYGINVNPNVVAQNAQNAPQKNEEINRLNKVIKDLRKDNSDSERSERDCKIQLIKLQEENEKLNKVIKDLRAENLTVKQICEERLKKQLKESADFCQKEKKKLKTQISDLQDGVDSMSEQLKNCNAGGCDEQEVKIAALNQLVEECRAHLIISQNELNTERSNKEELSSQIETLQRRMGELQKIIDDLTPESEPEGEEGYDCVRRWNRRSAGRLARLKSCERVVSNKPIDNITRFRNKQTCVTECNEDQG